MDQITNATGLMAQLLRDLKPEMNGAVTGAMEQRGISYPLNYGVSIPTIRTIAKRYAPNHKLARLLYQQQVRELILCALEIADPTMMSVEESDFWANGILNSEVAEHAAQLVARCGVCGEMAAKFMADNRPMVVYAGLIGLAKGVKSEAVSIDAERFIELARSAAEGDDRNIRRGVELLCVAMAKKSQSGLDIVMQLCGAWSSSQRQYDRDLATEIAWQVE